MKLTSIKVVIAKVIRDWELGDQEIPVQSMIEWMAEALEAIGAYTQFTTKEAEIEIDNFKGELPCDHHDTIRIVNGIYLDNYNPNLLGDEEPTIKANTFTNYDYSINHNTITTAYCFGKIKIQYLAMPLDDCGLPMVPDEYSYREALYWRVTMNLIRLDKVKSTHLTWKDARSEYLRYVGQSRAKANMPDLVMMERIKNNWLRLKPDIHAYSKLFSDLGKSGYSRE